MLKQCVLAVLIVLAGGLLLSNDGGETVGGITVDVPFAGVTVEAQAVFRGCSGGYVEATKTGWVRTRNGMERGTVRYCKKPPAPSCAWNETLHWRSGWVCVPRPTSSGIPSSKSDGHTGNPKSGVKVGPESCKQTPPGGGEWPDRSTCARNDLVLTFDITSPTWR